MVLMNLLHAPIWFFFRVAREEDTRTAAEKYGYISEMVKRINRRGRVTVTATGTRAYSVSGRILYCQSSRSLFDMLALFSTCPRPLSVVIKKEASNWIPGRSRYWGQPKSLAMDRDDIKDQVRIITEVTKRVKSGRNFVIFAEGHRSPTEMILDFKSGNLSLGAYCKTGAPRVPVALVNSFRPFDMNSLKREEVQVHYMEPILPDQYMGMKTSEIAHLVHDRIQGKK